MEPQTLLDPARLLPSPIADWAGREEAPLLLGEASTQLARAARVLTDGLSAGPALAEVAAAAAAALAARRCAIYLRDPDGEDLLCAAAHEDGCGGTPEWIAHARIPAATAGLDPVLRRGLTAELRLPPIARGRHRSGVELRPSLLLPIPFGQEWGGVLALDPGGVESLDGPVVRDLAAAFAALAGAAAQAARREERGRTAAQQVRVLAGHMRTERRATAVREELLDCDPLAAEPAEIGRILAAGLGLPCEVLCGDATAAFDARGEPFATLSLLSERNRGHEQVAAALAAVGEGEPAVLGPYPHLGLPQRHLVARAGAGGAEAWVALAESGRALLPGDLRLARRGAVAVARAERARRRLADAEEGVREAALRDALAGRDPAASLHRRLFAAGFDPSVPALVCLLGGRSGPLGAAELRAAATRAGSRLVDFCVATPDGVALLVPLAARERRRAAIAAVRGELAELLEALRGAGCEARAVVSSVCRSPAELPAALAECRELWEACADDGEPVLCADDLGAARLLLGRVSEAATERFVEEALGPVGEGEEGVKLLDTLDVFFAVNRSVRAAAAQLGIHENTVRHRFRRLAAATGLDVLGSTDDQLTARLALTLQRLRRNPTARKEPT